MNLVVRRRLAAGALLSSSALVAGLILAPSSSAATDGLSISPSGAVNTDTADTLTFTGKDADFEYGGTATFQRAGGGQPFTATIGSPTLPTGPTHSQTGTVDFTDPDGDGTASGGGVGQDGPADAGVYNVTATGASSPVPNPVAPGGGTDTCSTCFTVLAAGPVAVSGTTPTSIRPGGTVSNFTVTGNNFERGTRIEFLLNGVVDSLITANTNPKDTSSPPKDIITGITTRTSMERTAHVDSNDVPGARDVRVTNLDGTTTTCTACFNVGGPPLTSISPTSGVNDPGTLVTVTFNGTSTSSGTPRLEFTGTPGSSTRDALSLDPVSGTTTHSGSTVSAQFDLSNAAPGAYQAVVRDNGVTNACESPCAAFTVIQSSNRKPPTVASLDDPSTAGSQHAQQAGTTKVFDINGTNFSKGVLIKTTATGVTVTTVQFVSPSLVKATFVADKSAAAGDYDVTATLTDGTASAACSKCYTVTAAAPSASPSASVSSSPSSSPCPSTSPSAVTSTGPTATGSPKASSTASPSASSTASSGGGLPSGLPISGLAVAAATPSDTATASISPSSSASSSCAARQAATLEVDTPTINAGQTARLFGTGAAGQAYSLQCYTRPSTDYSEARSGTFDTAGDPVEFDLHLGRNTRCFLRYVTNPGQDASDSVVVNVKTVLSLSAVRHGVRNYEFRGRNLPLASGQLITLYRIDNAGHEIRTANLKTDSSGIFTVTRTFTGSGTFRFRVRTSQTNDNAAGASSTITVNIH
jgi:hypothetical protein